MRKFEQVEEIIESMIVDLKGIDKEYITDEQYDEGDDIVFAQPRYVTTDKNGHFHLEYVVMSIEKGGTIRSMGMGEDHGDEKVLSVDDLSWGVYGIEGVIFYRLCY